MGSAGPPASGRVAGRAEVRGGGRPGELAVDVRAGRHELVSDEPASNGGRDAGPAPYELLLAALGSCTAITLRMYADRKGWLLPGSRVLLSYHLPGDGDVEHIRREIRVEGDLVEAQRARLAEIAERTPVTRVLRRATEIRTHWS